MAQAFVEPGKIRGYHAHIYYDSQTRPIAERLRQAIGNRFAVELGRWREDPVGPLPCRCIRLRLRRPSFRASCRG